jgi:hypothetical protein
MAVIHPFGAGAVFDRRPLAPSRRLADIAAAAFRYTR